MFNCITDITHWFSHNSMEFFNLRKCISLNMTKNNTIIFSRHS